MFSWNCYILCVGMNCSMFITVFWQMSYQFLWTILAALRVFNILMKCPDTVYIFWTQGPISPMRELLSCMPLAIGYELVGMGFISDKNFLTCLPCNASRVSSWQKRSKTVLKRWASFQNQFFSNPLVAYLMHSLFQTYCFIWMLCEYL